MNNFDFVKDISLNEKLKETYIYIKFLLSLERKNIASEVLISLNRDIIIHIASILEWLLSYLLIEIYNRWTKKEMNVINKLLIKKEYKKVSNIKIKIYIEEKEVYYCFLKEEKWKINWKLNLWIILKFLKKLKIFNNDLYEWIEDIQKIRNDLHIQKSLENNLYEKELSYDKMLEIFKFTRKIQDKIIIKLNDLNK